jgi:nitrilase
LPAGPALTHDPSCGVCDDLTEAASRHHTAAGQCFGVHVRKLHRPGHGGAAGIQGPARDDPHRGWLERHIAPTGQILAGPNRNTQTILYADIDMAMLGLFK